VIRIGQMPVSFALGGFHNVERPEFVIRWAARLAIALVFPE
jgi:hypothetical protein